MKTECLKDNLEKALSSASRVSSKNTSLPVLQTVYLKTNKNNIEVRATDLEVGVETSIPAKISNKGECAVPADVFYRLVSSFPNGENITLEVQDGNLITTSKTNKTRIKLLPADDFPTIPKLKDAKPEMIESKSFAEGLRSVWFCASVSSMKPELSSVYIHNQNGVLVFAATDSFRLAEKKVFGLKNTPIDETLIPFKNTPELLKFFDSAQKNTEIKVSENQLSFKSGDHYFTTRTVDGNFPDYKQIIPKEFSTEITLLKQDLIDSLKTSNIFSNKFNQVKLIMDPKNSSFVISTQNQDLGESSTKLKSTLQGQEVEISFNYKYIMDSFQSIPQDSVTLKLSGEGKPMVITGVGDTSFLYLVMPMNR